jgi:hypothetical protein
MPLSRRTLLGTLSALLVAPAVPLLPKKKEPSDLEGLVAYLHSRPRHDRNTGRTQRAMFSAVSSLNYHPSVMFLVSTHAEAERLYGAVEVALAANGWAVTKKKGGSFCLIGERGERWFRIASCTVKEYKAHRAKVVVDHSVYESLTPEQLLDLRGCLRHIDASYTWS